VTLATARLLVGRKIVGFELNSWKDENGTHYNPIITLDNGASISFSVTETESGAEYGAEPSYHPFGLRPKEPSK
jgi:hypothetical protein